MITNTTSQNALDRLLAINWQIASFPRKDWSHYEHLTPLLQLESSVLDKLDLRETIA